MTITLELNPEYYTNRRTGFILGRQPLTFSVTSYGRLDIHAKDEFSIRLEPEHLKKLYQMLKLHYEAKEE